MEMTTSSTENDSTILALNDDCLFAVFEYLDWWDLVAIADTCSRFRQNARACFAHTMKDDFELCCYESIYQEMGVNDGNEMMAKVSKCMRNFGELIVKLNVHAENEGGEEYDEDEEVQGHSREIIELLVRYCSSALIDLELWYVNLKDDSATTMGPLVGRLHGLKLHKCRIEGMFLSMWPFWSAELRELEWNGCSVPWARYDSLHQPFPKLTKIVLGSNDHLQSIDIAEMLRHNPQLKELEFRCQRPTNSNSLGTIMQAIAQHVPDIESLSFYYGGRVETNPETNAYSSQLKNLKSFILSGVNKECLLPVIGAIGLADIPLKHLNLHLGRGFPIADTHTLVRAVSRFKQLETLEIRGRSDLSTANLIEICKKCSELSIMTIHGTRPTPEGIVQIVRYLKKLQSLVIFVVPVADDNLYCIDINVFDEMVNMVENRMNGMQTHLNIELINSSRYYTTNVPNELARAHKKTLSIVLN